MTFKKPEEVEKTDDDKLLRRVWKRSAEPKTSLDGTDYLEITLQLLNHVFAKKKMLLLQTGGEDGNRLTRAAFSVITKFSEQTEMFRQIVDEVEMLGLTIDGDKKSAANLNLLAEKVREVKGEEFDMICSQWETASQIRTWT